MWSLIFQRLGKKFLVHKKHVDVGGVVNALDCGSRFHQFESGTPTYYGRLVQRLAQQIFILLMLSSSLTSTFVLVPSSNGQDSWFSSNKQGFNSPRNLKVLKIAGIIILGIVGLYLLYVFFLLLFMPQKPKSKTKKGLIGKVIKDMLCGATATNLLI